MSLPFFAATPAPESDFLTQVVSAPSVTPPSATEIRFAVALSFLLIALVACTYKRTYRGTRH